MYSHRAANVTALRIQKARVPLSRRLRRRKEWAKQMALEKRKAALLEKFASSMGVGIIGSSSPPLLPPLEGTPLENLDLGSTSVFFECPACPPSVENQKTKIPIGLLEQHRAWHVRVNALIGLRARTKDGGGNAQYFGPGPGFPGILAMVEYTYKVRKKGTKVLGKWMARGEFVIRKRMEPLVTLTYVDGLQYTVGNKFLGRQKQGEFVFFDMEEIGLEDEDNDYDSDSDDSSEEEKSDDEEEASEEEEETQDVGSTDVNKKENYFTLTCNDDGIWISKNRTEASCPSTVVSVNGVPLLLHQGPHPCCQGEAVSKPINQGKCRCTRRLEFGDVVSISQGEGGNFIDFLFKASKSNEGRQVDSEDESGMETEEEVVVVSNATALLENPLVLQNILQFLPTTKLQGFRSLSQIWNTEALKALRNRVTVKLFERSIQSDEDNRLMQISTYAYSQMNALRFPHWKLELNKDWRSCGPGESKMSMGDKKLAEDFTWFLDPQSHTHKVKSLTLYSDRAVASKTHLALYETVLRAPGMKNHITTLDLSFYFQDSLALPPALEEMPSLRDLILCIGCTKRLEPCFFQAFNETFLPAVGSIHSFKLTNPINPPVAFSSFVLSGIALLQPLKFQHLSHVLIANGGDEHIGPLATLRKGSLKSLTLLGCNPGELSFSSPLRLAFERHRDSLEELSLHFDVRTVGNLSINFPHHMPKLRSLEILLCAACRTEPLPPPRFRFGGLESPTVTSIDYTSVFPSLQCLTVWPVAVATKHYGYRSSLDNDIPIKSVLETGWGAFLPILRPFVTPSSPSPVHSLRRVEVPLLLEDKYNSVLDNLERTFPSTRFSPSLTQARLRPVWMPPQRPRPPRPRYLPCPVPRRQGCCLPRGGYGGDRRY